MGFQERAAALRSRLEGRAWYQVARDTVVDWKDDEAPRLSASLAYYALFSIAPLLIVAIAIAGLVFDEGAAREQMLDTIGGLLGEEGRQGVETLLGGVARPSANVAAAVVGVLVLLFGATGAFAQLQEALNRVWEVRPKPRQGLRHVVRKRLLSLGIVLGVGFLLIVSLVLSAALAALGRYMSAVLPANETAWFVVNSAVALVVLTAAFAVIFKFLPDARIGWRDVLLGAAITAALFEVGKLLLGLYLGTRGLGSAYGAAGSVMAILIWVYYASLIFFLGAEFTQVWATRRGSPIEPEPHATWAANAHARAGRGAGRRRGAA